MRKTKNNYVPAEYGGYLFPKSCLPDILPGDGGKVLTVNETETAAEWANASGGGGVMKVAVTYDEENMAYVLANTWNEIVTALTSGVFVYIMISNSFYYPVNIFEQETSCGIIFAGHNGFDVVTMTFNAEEGPDSYPVKYL